MLQQIICTIKIRRAPTRHDNINTRAYKIDRFRKQVHTTDLQSGKKLSSDRC